MNAILFTGFPGFLGSALLPRVLARAQDAEAVCLVQQKYLADARRRLGELQVQHPAIVGRVSLVEGDITLVDLGLTDVRTLQARVVEIFHLAAVYDLSVDRDLAMRVNVAGTQHVLAFAEKCRKLRRFQYVSTCYVSGKFPGTFTEDMLQEGQQFNNFYEETKYLAEVEVQQAMRNGLPVTIYRPSVVVGDSTSGVTQKYDGPYYAIQWMLRQPIFGVMPVVGNSRRTRFNVVPRNFVVDAIAYLSGRAESRGQVYQLADPNPLTIKEMLRELGKRTRRHLLPLHLPVVIAKTSIEKVPGVYALLRIPSTAIDYFVLPTHFSSSRTQADLAGSGISCPPFREYSARLVDFMRAHPEVGAVGMS